MIGPETFREIGDGARAEPEAELRDRLAVDRTQLANERTLLAYIRTGLALIATGAGILGFLGTPAAQVGGGTLLALGIATLPIGLWRFIRIRQHIADREASHPPG